MMNRPVFVTTFMLAAFMIFAVHSLNFRGSVPDFVAASDGGTLLDVKPSFNEDQTYARLRGYGEAGRENYAFRNRTVDVLLPLTVFPFFFLLMLHSVGRLSVPSIVRVALLSLPVIYVVFDFAENAAVLMLLSRFPARMPTLAAALPYITVTKRAASILALLLPLLIFGFTSVRNRWMRNPRIA